MIKESTSTVKSTSEEARPGSYLRSPLPFFTSFKLVLSLFLRQKRSFHLDAQKYANLEHIRIMGEENLPADNHSILLTINHYTQPGVGVWNGIIALSSFFSAEIHWIITSTLTFEHQKKDIILRPFSHFMLTRVARMYNFSTMPPMPPHPEQVLERAIAVKNIIDYINSNKGSRVVIGLAPEGQDFPEAHLGWPPSGSGRFILQLARKGLMIVPIGLYEEDHTLCLRFGVPYYLDEIDPGSPAEIDEKVCSIVMTHIANLLPNHLQGVFATR